MPMSISNLSLKMNMLDSILSMMMKKAFIKRMHKLLKQK